MEKNVRHTGHISKSSRKIPHIEIEDGAVITEHENIYSSGGASSLWNLILYLVEKYSDRETAVLIAKYFALDISRDNQSQFAIFRGQRNHADLDIQQAQDYIEKKYEEKITVEERPIMSILGGEHLNGDSKKQPTTRLSNTCNAYASKLQKNSSKHHEKKRFRGDV
jgi:hypothetical protein